MSTIPLRIEGAIVTCYSPIDVRHHHTGNCRQIVAGMLQGTAAGLAICQYEGDDSFYLFSCDENWHVVSDTCHDTLEEAKRQAEFEYDGVSSTWVSTTQSTV